MAEYDATLIRIAEIRHKNETKRKLREERASRNLTLARAKELDAARARAEAELKAKKAVILEKHRKKTGFARKRGAPPAVITRRNVVTTKNIFTLHTDDPDLDDAYDELSDDSKRIFPGYMVAMAESNREAALLKAEEEAEKYMIEESLREAQLKWLEENNQGGEPVNEEPEQYFTIEQYEEFLSKQENRDSIGENIDWDAYLKKVHDGKEEIQDAEVISASPQQVNDDEDLNFSDMDEETKAKIAAEASWEQADILRTKPEKYRPSKITVSIEQLLGRQQMVEESDSEWDNLGEETLGSDEEYDMYGNIIPRKYRGSDYWYEEKSE